MIDPVDITPTDDEVLHWYTVASTEKKFRWGAVARFQCSKSFSSQLVGFKRCVRDSQHDGPHVMAGESPDGHCCYVWFEGFPLNVVGGKLPFPSED